MGGPGFVKALRGPMPWSSVMPTGGVAPTRENLTEWFEAGVFCLGMGSKLITKDVVGAGRFDELERRVRETLEIIAEVRK